MSVAPVGDTAALRRQIAATQARFAAVGARLARAAEAMATSGALPPDGLLREVQDAAQQFYAVRAAVQDAAASLEILPAVLPREVTSLRELGPVMETVARAAEQAARRRRLDAARAMAFAVLNQVSAIVHRDQPRFDPLAACHDKARALGAAIAAADPLDVDLEMRVWARAVAPFAALLELVVGPDPDADAPWSGLEEAVGLVFGRRLATAAARGKLLIR
jgi:hypothetical protein